MILTEKIGFRALCGKFIALIDQKLVQCADPLSLGNANTVLLYGFNDHEAGISFLAFGTAVSQPWQVVSTSVPHRIFRRSHVLNKEFTYADQFMDDSSLHKKIYKTLERHVPTEEIAHFRRKGCLDAYRSKQNPDILRVPVGSTNVMVNILVDPCLDYGICGKVINEPSQKTILHRGDRAEVHVQVVGTRMCHAWAEVDHSV